MNATGHHISCSLLTFQLLFQNIFVNAVVLSILIQLCQEREDMLRKINWSECLH